MQRLYIHQPLYRRLVRKVVDATRRLRRGDPAQGDTIIGPMIDEANLVRVAAWVNEAIAGGAVPLLAGRRRGGAWPHDSCGHPGRA